MKKKLQNVSNAIEIMNSQFLKEVIESKKSFISRGFTEPIRLKKAIRLRDIFNKKYISHLTIAEIAKQYGISNTRVNQLLNRVLSYLKYKHNIS